METVKRNIPISLPVTGEEEWAATREPLVSGWLTSGPKVREFEELFAHRHGVKHAFAVTSATTALHLALVALGVGPGDEVIVPAFTWVSTANVVVYQGATVVLVDVDPVTFNMDVNDLSRKITCRTKAIIPVHILGLPANMPQILAIAKKHNLAVIEDACQAHMAEINHQKVGTFGDAGCFSFQNSKNLAIGEAGAIVSNNDLFMDRCFSYHNYGNPFGMASGVIGAGTIIQGNKQRITEYQAAIGLAQLKRLDAETTLRNENAAYLKAKIEKIPGIVPYKLYDNVTRAAFHLFPFRYKKEGFKGLSRDTFLKALSAEGIPCSKGYATLNNMPYLNDAFQSKNFQKMYPKAQLDFKSYVERNHCPQNDRLCNEEAVWFTQNMLLGTKADMDEIANAIEKIYTHADKLLSTK